MEPFEYCESILIDATPEAVYDLVTDISRTGEWSPICRTCRWQDGDGAREGAWLIGRNEADGQVWETRSQVAVAERGREFAWLVGGKYVRWSYEFELAADGRTRLTESWKFLEEGRAMFAEKFGSEADGRIRMRRSQAISGIPVTLVAIKQIAEGGRPE